MDKQKNNRLTRSSQSIADDNNKPTETRRRGEVLENAILQAAWDELNEVGYANLTMEHVAERAGTNKAAIYRRWGNRAELVVAALRKHIDVFHNAIPDTGNLRDDVIIHYRSIVQLLKTVGSETIHGLMVEYHDDDLISSAVLARQSGTETMMKILKHAELRGEGKIDKINPRVIMLPGDLLRYEVLMTDNPVSDKTITEIVDDIFMPLILKELTLKY